MVTAKAILMLILSTSTPTLNYDNIDVGQAYCLAINIWHEARSEDIEGQFAVAHATLARVRDKRYPNTICEVVYDSVPDPVTPWLPKKHACAFSWHCDGKSDKIVLHYRSGKVNIRAVKTFTATAVVALMAMTDEIDDFCEQANFYYNPELANPNWGEIYTETCVIGKHRFLRREDGSLL